MDGFSSAVSGGGLMGWGGSATLIGVAVFFIIVSIAQFWSSIALLQEYLDKVYFDLEVTAPGTAAAQKNLKGVYGGSDDNHTAKRTYGTLAAVVALIAAGGSVFLSGAYMNNSV